MRLALCSLFVCLVLCSVAESQEGPPTAPSMKIGSKPTTRGDARTVSRRWSLEARASVKMNGKVVQELKESSREVEESKLTVMTLDSEGIITTARVQILKRRTRLGDQAESVSKGEGGSYHLAVDKEGKARLLDDAGKALGKELEEELLGSEAASLAAFDQGWFALLPDREIRYGESIPVAKERADELIDLADFRVQRCKLTFSGAREKEGRTCAVFKVWLSLSGEPDEDVQTMGAELSGELLLFKDSGHLRSLSLSGPVVVKGHSDEDGVKVEVDGLGRMTLELDYAAPTVTHRKAF